MSNSVVLPERRAMQMLQQGCERLNQSLGRDDPLPRLRFDLRGRNAGMAVYKDWVIRLNAGLLHAHGQTFIEDTVPHELAHLVAFAHFGPHIKPHGREWKALMQILGKPAKVTHNYSVAPARKLKRYAYQCPCMKHELSSIRHARYNRGARYSCLQCGEVLLPVEAGVIQ